MRNVTWSNMVSRHTFQKAIVSYRFPISEPIFSVDLNGDHGAPGYPQAPCLFVFRPAGPKAEWHKTIETFWASVLFNFLEDCLDDHSFEELGESGEYRELAQDDARRVLGELIGDVTSDYITTPGETTSCCLIYDDPKLRALVGTDSAGMFAVIWRNWNSHTSV